MEDEIRGAPHQQAYIKASNTQPSDWFGWSLALSADGDTLAVGAPQEDSNATEVDGNQNYNSATDSGAVYVFTLTANNWSQQAYVKASNMETIDEFGWSAALSLDGDTLAVGAIKEASNSTGIGGVETDNSAGVSGAVYTYTRAAGNWTPQAYIKASNSEAGDDFGWSIALSGDGGTLAVGADLEDGSATGIGGNQSDNSATGGGAVYLY